MPHDRFFSPSPLIPGEIVALHEAEARHMKVMRLKKGDPVELVDGQGNLATGTVIDAGQISLDQVEHQEKPTPAIQLAIALPHPSHLDWMVEKVTELGVDTLLFFPGQLSEFKTLKPNQLERLNRIIIAATKQCGRLYLPSLELRPPLKKWDPPKNAAFGSLNPTDPYLTEAQLFFIGPEKGFHPDELELFKQWEVAGKQLNPNILRAETAAVTAAALLLAKRGTLRL